LTFKKKSDLDIERERYSKRAEINKQNKTSIQTQKRKNNLIDAPYLEIYFKALMRNAKKDFKLLEICSGEGQCSIPILKYYKNITFTDISKNSLEIIKKNYKPFLTSKITFKECNMELLPFDNAIFDIVACAGGLSYGDNKLVLNEIHRVLKPNGIFICIDSLNDNPIYKLNRYLHYLKGNRTKSTLKRMPDSKLLEAYKRKFGATKIIYSGTLIWILYPLSKIIGYRKSKILSDFFDNKLPRCMSFKFIMEAQKLSQ
jgi:ubiquinone/menaquinone biosynthesis C-methylase UbiE